MNANDMTDQELAAALEEDMMIEELTDLLNTMDEADGWGEPEHEMWHEETAYPEW